jgi:TetR/AcrR family transcriptional regulator, regulator of mycofactocin system
MAPSAEGKGWMETQDPTAIRPRMGRAPSTTKAELGHIGLRLSIENGFDATTIDDIARAAGIGRRTFFRYFASKNDLPWGDFESLLETMRSQLAGLPGDVALWDGLRRVILDFNRVPEAESGYHRQRMDLLLHVPTLLAHSTLRYASWRQVVAEHVAQRLGLPIDDLVPQTIAWTCLAVCLAAYEQWLREPDAQLLDLLDEAFDMVHDSIDTDAAVGRRNRDA